MMRLRLWHRVFALTALATLGALATLLAVQQQGFRRGLLEYVNQIDRERALKTIPAFAAEYRDEHSWERLRNNPERFRRVLDQTGAGMGERPPPPPFARPPRDESDRPGPPGERDGRPPRPEDRPPRDDRPPRGLAGAGPGEPARRRYALRAADDSVVIGPREDWPDAVRLPIEIDGKVVGTLLMRPLPRLENEWDLDFASAQLKLSLITAGVVLLLAILASVVFARRLARPLRWMADQANRIAGGDYAARVAIERADEIGELARDFDAMAAALARNREARQRWTAEISHELRTPIAVMRAELDALQDGIRPFDRNAITSLSGEADRLSRLVEDLYQLSLADAGALDYRFEDSDLAQLTREVVAAHAASFERAGLSVTLELPETAPMRADPVRVRQLLANLCANSCRYTDRGGSVRVRIAPAGARWKFSIDDSAPGVPTAALPQLFDPLFRVESSRNRAHGGAGLGLAIVRRIAEAHTAEIHAEASALGGLRILILWPSST